jgi:hypothetical protein
MLDLLYMIHATVPIRHPGLCRSLHRAARFGDTVLSRDEVAQYRLESRVAAAIIFLQRSASFHRIAVLRNHLEIRIIPASRDTTFALPLRTATRSYWSPRIQKLRSNKTHAWKFSFPFSPLRLEEQHLSLDDGIVFHHR